MYHKNETVIKRRNAYVAQVIYFLCKTSTINSDWYIL